MVQDQQAVTVAAYSAVVASVQDAKGWLEWLWWGLHRVSALVTVIAAPEESGWIQQQL